VVNVVKKEINFENISYYYIMITYFKIY
jgi:hypothetical protein